MAASSPTRYVIIGAGGLGCPAAIGLLAGGVKRLTIVDDDRVDASNLQRQTLYTTADVGRPKVSAAAYFLKRRNPQLEVEPVFERLSSSGLQTLIETYKERVIVLEATDSPRLKFEVNDLCRKIQVPLVIGGVLAFRGQAMAIAPIGPCFRCVFEEAPPPEHTPTCAEAGVLGATAGIVGMWMANLAIGLANDITSTAGKFFSFELGTQTFLGSSSPIRELNPAPRKDCINLCGQDEYKSSSTRACASNRPTQNKPSPRHQANHQLS